MFYVYFEEFGHILLIATVKKSEDTPISNRGKRQLASLIDEEKKILNARHFF